MSARSMLDVGHLYSVDQQRAAQRRLTAVGVAALLLGTLAWGGLLARGSSPTLPLLMVLTCGAFLVVGIVWHRPVLVVYLLAFGALFIEQWPIAGLRPITTQTHFWRAFARRPQASPRARATATIRRRLARSRRSTIDGPPEAVPLPEYAATLRRLLTLTGDLGGVRLILMEPYLIEPDRTQPMRRCLDAYGAVGRDLATTAGAVLVRTQAAFDAALAQTTPDAWADDQIHPNALGHAVIALAFLRAVEVAL